MKQQREKKLRESEFLYEQQVSKHICDRYNKQDQGSKIGDPAIQE